MRIKSVTIKNYRAFDSEGVHIPFPDIQAPISIVGHNNCGKTSILESIRFACGYKDNWDKCDLHDFYFNKIDSNVEIIVNFSEPIQIPTIYGKDKNKECWGAKFIIREQDGEYQTFNQALDENGEVVRLQSQLRGSAPPISFIRNRNALNIFFIDFKDLDKHLKINGYSLLGKVIEEIKKDFKLSTNTIKNKEGKDIAREKYYQRVLEHIEEYIMKTKKLEEFMETIEKSIKHQLNMADKSIKLTFKLPESEEIYDSMQFKLADHESKPPIPINNLGDGFKSMLIVAILRILLKADEGGRIIILEEPETFLHEHFQEYFYQVLSKLAVNNQIIYSTHSKKFVNIFEPESIIRIKNDKYIKAELVDSINKNIDMPKSIGDFKIEHPKDFRKYMNTLEPNLGNMIFASKVIIVEGPDDLLVYKTILSEIISFGIKNIAVIVAWGKDPIITLVQICKKFEIPYFVIHDWDLVDDIDPNTKPEPLDEKLKRKLINDKAQWTKNKKIADTVGNKNLVHHNKVNLEGVLDIPINLKNASSAYSKIRGLSISNIRKVYPTLVPDKLLEFLGIDIVNNDSE